MYEIIVEASFSAAHAIVVAGERETLHGHNWHLEVTVAGERLDPDGLLCDFHTVREMLGEVIGPFENRNLNEVRPFDRVNPSAENVAKHIADELSARLDAGLAPHARVAAVSVTEATGCRAVYRPTGAGKGGSGG